MLVFKTFANSAFNGFRRQHGSKLVHRTVKTIKIRERGGAERESGERERRERAERESGEREWRESGERVA